MYLLDTNIWLERLLNQDRSSEVGKFLSDIETSSIAMSDFSFHSIGVILTHYNKIDLFIDFTDDVFINGKVTLCTLTPHEMSAICTTIGRFNLDFDDAYQYTVSRKYSYEFISFDKDFDKTDISRKEPQNFL